MEVSQWRHAIERQHITCESCLELHEQKNKKPPCTTTCGWTRVIPENYEVMGLIDRYFGLMVNSMGINPDGIRLALEIEGVEDINTTTQKIVIYLSSALSKRNEDIIDGQKRSNLSNKGRFEGRNNRGQAVRGGNRNSSKKIG